MQENIHSEEVIHRVRRATYVGLAINLVLSVLKGFGGIVWCSQALFADAVHSLSDILTDVAVILGVRYWSAPPDEDHPYGHGKIEALVTLFISIALAIVAWGLGKNAIESLFANEHKVTPNIMAFIFAVVSVLSKEWLFRWTRGIARSVRSPALEANAWHHRSDALSSIPVAVAIALVSFFPSLWWADAVGALIVAFFLCKVVWDLSKPALQELIDAGIDDKSGQVSKVAMSVDGVRGVHCCRARRYGGAFHADLHIQVDSSLSVVAAHDLAHAVKHAILASDLDVIDVVIHVEPAK